MKKYYAIILLLLAFSCREKYVPPVVAPAGGYLVVEGNINSGNAPTTIVLSRTNSLSETTKIYEEDAKVLIEGNDNSSYTLPQTLSGYYTLDNLILDNNKTYRLHITTKEGKEYISSFVQVKQTPPIDSISWIKETEGVRMYINAHDATGNTRYYLWNYDETWEYHSAYISLLTYNDKNPNKPTIRYIDSVTLGPIEEIMVCWNSRSSTSLLLGSTAKLTEDKVFLPINFIANASKEMSVLYSINVKQFALSKDAYEYLEKMRKNTEGTGSIFDPQPSSLRGNISCVNNPDEIVIGYVNASSVVDKRKFIAAHELGDWGYRTGCEEFTVENKPDSVKKAYDMLLYPTDIASSLGPNIISFHVTRSKACFDCTTSGTNIKPTFWP